MRLPDGAKSRALLIGTAAYESLSGVPASRNNLRALKDALQRHTGLPPEHCRTLLDAPDLAAVGREVEAATSEAADLLLVYYSGHGLIDSDGLLHLALPQTSQKLLPWNGIPFKLLHHAIQVARAKTKVLILDCCFSGRATQLLGDDENNIMGQIVVNGTFTLTSSPAHLPAYAFEGSDHTAFTGALLQLLEDGSPGAGAMLTLNDIYIGLLHHAQEHGLPQPQKCGTHTADMLPLATNRQFAIDVERAVADELFPEVPQQVTDEPTDTEAPVERPSASDAPLLTVHDIENVLFKTVLFTEGYDEDEVDDFLDTVAMALADPAEGPQLMNSVDIVNAEFTITRLREGYDMTEVDAFLDRVILEFERRQAFAAVYLGSARGVGGPHGRFRHERPAGRR